MAQRPTEPLDPHFAFAVRRDQSVERYAGRVHILLIDSGVARTGCRTEWTANWQTEWGVRDAGDAVLRLSNLCPVCLIQLGGMQHR